MSEIVPAEKRQRTIRDLFSNPKMQSMIVSALPRHLDATRMLRLYQTAAQVTRGIAECELLSVVGAVVQAAQLGLSLDTIMGEAYLIPRYNKWTRSQVCQFQIGYKGYIKLARQADAKLLDIFAHTVHENDKFEYELGMDPKILVHKPVLKDRGALIAAYAVGVWDGGYKRVELVDADDVARAMERSDAFQNAEAKGKKTSPWHTDPDPMWRKTAIRRWGARVPLSSGTELATAMLSETVDGRTFYNAGMDVSGAALTAASELVPEVNSHPQQGDEPALTPPTPSALDLAAERVNVERQRETAPVQPLPTPAATRPASGPASTNTGGNWNPVAHPAATPTPGGTAAVQSGQPARAPKKPAARSAAKPAPAPAAPPAPPPEPPPSRPMSAQEREDEAAFRKLIADQAAADAAGDPPPPDDSDLPDNVERLPVEPAEQERLFPEQQELYRTRRGMSDPDDDGEVPPEDDGAPGAA